MAFDNPTRNRLARLVSDCRRLLTDEFSIQLQQHYGIQPDGQIIPLEQLGHLDDEQRGVAVMLRERISHIASGLTDEKRPAEAAVDRLLREQAFTVLNRFAALRMCEERELVQECVRGGLHSRGFKVFLQIAGSGLGDTWQRYRTFLYLLFDEISIDLGLLFDRFSPFGLLFPREAALEELFQLLNTPDLQSIWSEDETIGWIYQYFNSKEERQAMRKASAAPRNSRELAVRNQFFTPRYVVEFLTDNTLGRTWYEMRQGQTRLTGQCRYLVRRPHEVFLQPGEEAPEPPPNQDDLSQEELLRQPHHISFRPKKDPRDLKILDPACGSGHFLLYAFDLLQTIYEEAWEDESMPAGETTGTTLRDANPDREKLLLAIPELILRHNLHGIDIDPRAVQIAALALWLRAQRAWKEQRVKPEERPRIRKSHIVCAEPMPGEKQMLREFAANLQPPLLGQIVERIFDRMQLAGEAGSLLKIEEEIQESISQAKEQWQRMYERARDKFGNQMLFTQSEMDNLRLDPQLLLGLFDVSQISDAEFWETIEERILAALREYAERSSGQSLSRRMFADDAAKGFAFIDLCRKRYDVVLMNPPFG
ncbi:MAG TPA: SAM-dependent methyltransferase, partial [bacterium]|nr:SAM-dependent methyltransferase [bacterium]